MKTRTDVSICTFLAALFLFISMTGAFAAQSWDKTFALSEKVIHQKVFYANRYGIAIAADLYMPKNMDMAKKYAAILVGTPYGGVKEQGAGIYAQTMAERGFIAMAFDESFNGESSGEPRHLSSPDIFVEDFSAGVDFVGAPMWIKKRSVSSASAATAGFR